MNKAHTNQRWAPSTSPPRRNAGQTRATRLRTAARAAHDVEPRKAIDHPGIAQHDEADRRHRAEAQVGQLGRTQVGGIIGAALVAGGAGVVHWGSVATVTLAIVISPLLGFAGAMVLLVCIYRVFARVERAPALPVFVHLQSLSAAYTAFSHGRATWSTRAADISAEASDDHPQRHDERPPPIVSGQHERQTPMGLERRGFRSAPRTPSPPPSSVRARCSDARGCAAARGRDLVVVALGAARDGVARHRLSPPARAGVRRHGLGRRAKPRPRGGQRGAIAVLSGEPAGSQTCVRAIGTHARRCRQARAQTLRPPLRGAQLPRAATGTTAPR
jgi:hypothetical protein